MNRILYSEELYICFFTDTKNCKIVVKDKDKNIIFQGKSTEKSLSFFIPRVSSFSILVIAPRYNLKTTNYYSYLPNCLIGLKVYFKFDNSYNKIFSLYDTNYSIPIPFAIISFN